MTLAKLYTDPNRVVVTAHRGCSGEFPENTLIAFDEAVRIGADIIEFDLRGTSDAIPVVLHDPTIDRTSNGTGSPGDYTLEQIRRYNFSLWHGPGSSGERLSAPKYSDCPIPTFRELLERYTGKIGLNIQVYDATSPLLETICDMYREFDLYTSGYLSMSTYADADRVRDIDKRIELCILEKQRDLDRATLVRQKEMGIRFVQPFRDGVTSEFCGWIRDLGMCCNMFYSNTDEDNRRYLATGLRGVLTDYPDILMRTIVNIEDLH
jgi:glycerophosphoryl diester phosphodiesterase